MRARDLPPTVSAAARHAAGEADNRPHPWPLTPRVTARLRAKGAARRRAGFEADRAVHGVEVEEVAGGHLAMSSPGARENAWVLWIHGGGFCWGSARDGTALRLAAGLDVPVVSVEYPLAPEARFPVAIETCLEAYLAGVAEHGKYGERVLLGGVSAGANLALGVLQRLRVLVREGRDVPLPVGMVALTPFGDLAGEGDSYRVNEGRDAWIRWRGQQQRFARAYAGGADLRDPLVSPVHADWSGVRVPPAFFSSGTRDLFLSDAVRIHTAWRTAGGRAELDVAEGMWHSYLSDASLPESAALLARLLDWCGERVHKV